MDFFKKLKRRMRLKSIPLYALLLLAALGIFLYGLLAIVTNGATRISIGAIGIVGVTIPDALVGVVAILIGLVIGGVVISKAVQKLRYMDDFTVFMYDVEKIGNPEEIGQILNSTPINTHTVKCELRMTPRMLYFNMGSEPSIFPASRIHAAKINRRQVKNKTLAFVSIYEPKRFDSILDIPSDDSCVEALYKEVCDMYGLESNR